MTRDQILERYRHLRAISTGHHSGALKFLSRKALLEHAKRLGLATGGMLVAESEAEMTLVFDLALYTAQEGRSRPPGWSLPTCCARQRRGWLMSSWRRAHRRTCPLPGAFASPTALR